MSLFVHFLKRWTMDWRWVEWPEETVFVFQFLLLTLSSWAWLPPGTVLVLTSWYCSWSRQTQIPTSTPWKLLEPTVLSFFLWTKNPATSSLCKCWCELVKIIQCRSYNEQLLFWRNFINKPTGKIEREHISAQHNNVIFQNCAVLVNILCDQSINTGGI